MARVSHCAKKKEEEKKTDHLNPICGFRVAFDERPENSTAFEGEKNRDAPLGPGTRVPERNESYKCPISRFPCIIRIVCVHRLKRFGRKSSEPENVAHGQQV